MHKTHVNNGIFTISTGDRRISQPSTVGLEKVASQKQAAGSSEPTIKFQRGGGFCCSFQGGSRRHQSFEERLLKLGSGSLPNNPKYSLRMFSFVEKKSGNQLKLRSLNFEVHVMVRWWNPSYAKGWIIGHQRLGHFWFATSSTYRIYI